MAQSLNELPTDLIKKIASYWNIRDKLRVSQATKYMRKIIDTNEFWENKVREEWTNNPKKPLK